MIFQDRSKFAEYMIKKYCTKLLSSSKILDIGSGYSPMRDFVINSGFRWQPVDYVQKIPEAIIWDLNFAAPKEVEEVDMAIMLEVLEHLPNPRISLEHIGEKIKSGGYLILSVPNPGWSKNRLCLLFKGHLYAFSERHLAEHHVFTTWQHIVEFYLQDIGFEVIEKSEILGIKKSYRNYKEVILSLLEKLIEVFDKESIGVSYGLVVRKL